MRYFSLPFILILTSFCTLGLSQDATLTISLEGTEITIPHPDGLAAKKNVLESMASFMESSNPNNELHEIFAIKSATDESYKTDGLKRNADVQTVSSLNNKMTQKIFDGIKELLSTQFDKMMKEVMKKINKDTTEDARIMKSIKKVGSGPFVNKKDSYSYLFFSSIKTEKTEVERVSAACICFIDGNMIMLNVHSNLESDADATWVKETAKKWIEATLKANPVKKDANR